MTSGSDSAEKFELWISGETKSYWRNEYLVCSCELKLVICLDFGFRNIYLDWYWILKCIPELILDFEMYTWIDFGFRNVHLDGFWISKCAPGLSNLDFAWDWNSEFDLWNSEFDGLRFEIRNFILDQSSGLDYLNVNWASYNRDSLLVTSALGNRLWLKIRLWQGVNKFFVDDQEFMRPLH
jgi:hypothetical protein